MIIHWAATDLRLVFIAINSLGRTHFMVLLLFDRLPFITRFKGWFLHRVSFFDALSGTCRECTLYLLDSRILQGRTLVPLLKTYVDTVRNVVGCRFIIWIHHWWLGGLRVRLITAQVRLDETCCYWILLCLKKTVKNFLLSLIGCRDCWNYIICGFRWRG